MNAPRSIWARALLRRDFLIAVGALLVAGVAVQGVQVLKHTVLTKKPVNLDKPLEELPTSHGRRFVLAREMHSPENDLHHGKAVMSADVEETLGTKDHITWFFKDTTQSAGRSLAYVRLHVAYYPRMLDAVPHVADICQLAGGMDPDPDDPPRHVSWTLEEPGPDWQAWRETAFQRSAFVRRERRGDLTRSVVFYVFSVNGEPVTDRLEVRRRLSNPTKRYCYYAKIELGAGDSAGTLEPRDHDEMCQAFWQSAGPAILAHLPTARHVAALEAGD